MNTKRLLLASMVLGTCAGRVLAGTAPLAEDGFVQFFGMEGYRVFDALDSVLLDTGKRGIMEFDLAGIVQPFPRATLTIWQLNRMPNFMGPVLLEAYRGDGIIAVGDWDTPASPVAEIDFPKGRNPQGLPFDTDVTSAVQTAYWEHWEYLGFRLSTRPNEFNDVSYGAREIPDSGHDLPPVLTYEEYPYTIVPGDANLDGMVNLMDLDILGRHYGEMGGWAEGDFDGNGVVHLPDLDLLGQYYGQCQCQDGGAVPEPATLSLLALGGLAVMRRRRK